MEEQYLKQYLDQKRDQNNVIMKFTERLKGTFSKEKDSDDNVTPSERTEEKVDDKEGLSQRVADYIAENGEKLQQWYSDTKLNEKIARVAKKVGAVIIYPVLLLHHTLQSPSISIKDKVAVVASLAYFILPVDLIPDVMVGVGYTEDILVIMAMLKKVSKFITPEILEQTKKQCLDIFGEVDDKVIDNVNNAIADKNQDLNC